MPTVTGASSLVVVAPLAPPLGLTASPLAALFGEANRADDDVEKGVADRDGGWTNAWTAE